MMSNIHVSAEVNGDKVEFLCDPRETLLDVLRDRLNLTGTKEGCGTGDVEPVQLQSMIVLFARA